MFSKEEFYVKVAEVNNSLVDEFKGIQSIFLITKYDSPELAMRKDYYHMNGFFHKCNYCMSLWLARAVDRKRISHVLAKQTATQIGIIFSDFIERCMYVQMVINKEKNETVGYVSDV